MFSLKWDGLTVKIDIPILIGHSNNWRRKSSKSSGSRTTVEHSYKHELWRTTRVRFLIKSNTSKAGGCRHLCQNCQCQEGSTQPPRRRLGLGYSARSFLPQLLNQTTTPDLASTTRGSDAKYDQRRCTVIKCFVHTFFFFKSCFVRVWPGGAGEGDR